jgi:P pilus assembly chaperone PapD
MSAIRPVGTVSLAATSTTGSVALTARGGGNSVVVSNKGPNWVHVKFGDSNVTAALPAGATAGDTPVGPGVQMTLRRDDGNTHMAAICAAGETATVWATGGEGE